MTKILIVEDEQIIAENISMMLKEMEYVVTGIALDVKEAEEFIEKERPDIALLDINLAGDQDDRSGIDLAALLNEKYDIPFIYITSYADPATILNATRTQAEAYLTKPIASKDLYANIEMAMAHREHYIIVKDGYDRIKVPMDDILWIESHGNFVKIHLKSGKYQLGRFTMQEIEEQHLDQRFIRIHRFYIINRDAINRISSQQIRIAGKDLPIGRAYNKEVKEKLQVEKS